ncbi:M18 family aminopeptidase [Streptomyces sp. NPDC051561]|uniref:M18 family aminopeptidase n=1 Tax=Streptomyces sp. NPDC051561 TaxID=3365658 RepID=UPI0037B5C131
MAPRPTGPTPAPDEAPSRAAASNGASSRASAAPPRPAFDHTSTHTEDLMAFLTASPTPYHAVAEAGRRLTEAGFVRVDARDAWQDGPGGRYLVRGGTLIAWYVPGGAPAHAPYRIVGAHTDSPNLRVKPRPDTGAAGWRQIAVEIYGGVPLNTWLDRDLGLAGRLTLRDGTPRLVRIDQPLLRVPQLAIHLDRDTNEGLRLDRQHHIRPLWGLGPATDGDLRRKVAAAAGLDAADVAAWDLMLHDLQPPALLGDGEQFLVGSRLDNLVSTHAGLTALLHAAADRSATDRSAPQPVQVLAAFDHEETGSTSATGASSPLLESVLRRAVRTRGGSDEDWERARAGAYCVSADMSHAVHPNYPERHDPDHLPLPNGGPAVKLNVNQRYATDSESHTVFTTACERAGVPWQSFVTNNSSSCGTSIGPLVAAQLGITTVDVGVPGLSMHSARELCGADDPHHLAAALAAFLTTH